MHHYPCFLKLILLTYKNAKCIRYTKLAIQSTRAIQSQDVSLVEHVLLLRLFGLLPLPPEFIRAFYTLHHLCVLCVLQRVLYHRRRERLLTPILRQLHTIVQHTCHRHTTPPPISQLRIQRTHLRIQRTRHRITTTLQL